MTSPPPSKPGEPHPWRCETCENKNTKKCPLIRYYHNRCSKDNEKPSMKVIHKIMEYHGSTIEHTGCASHSGAQQQITRPCNHPVNCEQCGVFSKDCLVNISPAPQQAPAPQHYKPEKQQVSDLFTRETPASITNETARHREKGIIHHVTGKCGACTGSNPLDTVYNRFKHMEQCFNNVDDNSDFSMRIARDLFFAIREYRRQRGRS